MKHKLFDDWGLKLGSIALAVFIWFIVTNFNDPVVSFNVRNVKVTLRNTNVITDQGQTYEILNDSNVIDTVTITAPRSVVNALSGDDVVAVADFQDLTLQNTVRINVTTNKYYSQIESIKPSIDSVELSIEDLQTKILALSTVTSGTVGEGYTIGDISTDENQVRISGPKSLIDQIVRAEVNIPVTGFSQDIVTDVDVVFMNADGEVIRSSSITSNISKVKAKVEMLQTKKVGLTFESTGVPADGFEATGAFSSDPETVLIAGRPSILKNIESIKVDEGINLTGQSGDMMTLIDITDFLPNGVKLADATFDGKVSVTAYIEKTVTRVVQLDGNKIRWENVPEGYKVELVDPSDKYNVSLRGLQNRLEKIDADAVIAIADLEDILEQTDKVGDHYHVVLRFENENGKLNVSTPVQVWFKLNET